MEKLWHEQGGSGGPLLVLLHGLGANGTVWDGLKPVLAEQWPGRWLIPDLRGHGRSFHRAPYGIGIHAADVAALLEQDEEVTVVGHSMGGVIAIALATGLFGVKVKQAAAFAVKMDWSEEDHARAEAVARTPAKLFASREEAVERYLRVSGLKGLVAPDSAAAAVGVREADDQFRLAVDPRTNAIGRPDFVKLAQAATSPVHLLCGDQDAVANPQSMARLGSKVDVLEGCGHNVHVEAPAAFWQAVARRLDA